MELFRERVYGIRTGQICLAALLLLAGLASAGDQIWRHDNRDGEPAVRNLLLNTLALRADLERVSSLGGPGSLREISLPMPDGSLARFTIEHSPVMEEGLARDFPEIQTFKVFGVDDPGAYGHVDITPQGFHAMLQTSQGRVFIDPKSGASQRERYQLRSARADPTRRYSCGVEAHGFSARPLGQSAARPAERIPGLLLSYRLAVSATEEYVQRVYDPAIVGRSRVQQAQDAIVSAVHRVNMIFERDLGIRLVLVSNNQVLIEDGGNVTFNNDNASLLFEENQQWIDSRLGRSRYDIGHIFTAGGGGLAWLGSACDPRHKAKGVSGVLDTLTDPESDPFYIDYVAHELGHQLNAEHSFNGTTRSCQTGRNQATAFEPGSGSTIMAYAGICGVENIAENSEPIFHAGSIDQIDAFTASSAGSCYTTVSAGNSNYPQVDPLANRVIPANTAFELEATASDGDGHALSFQWDQMDAGCSTNAFTYGTDTGYNALFRSLLQVDNARRHFPALRTQLNGLYDDAEVMACNTRAINLRLTARDGRSGVSAANMQVSVQDTGRTFEVTNLATPQTIADGAPFDVHWQVALTDLPPINCANVDIDLLTFAPGYASYSEHNLLTTANAGVATVQVPFDKSHPLARIRVKCSDNVFYDISEADLAFTSSAVGATVYDDNAITVPLNDYGTTGSFAPACGAIAQCSAPDVPEVEEEEDGIKKGSGAFDYAWLILLTAISMLCTSCRGRSRRKLRGCSEA